MSEAVVEEMATPASLAWKRQLELYIASADLMRREKIWTDVVLVLEDRELPAHRLILGASSLYFRAMLQIPMAENITGRIDMKTYDPEAVEVVLHFMYTGQVRVKDDENELMKSVMETSHLLQVETLFDYAIQALAKKITSEHFLDMCNIAEFYSQTKVLDDLNDRLAADFQSVSLSHEFLQMNSDQLQHILKLVNANLTETALLAVLKWTKVDLEKRNGDVATLLKLLNNNFLSEKFLKELLIQEPMVQQNQEILSFLFTSVLQYLGNLPEWSTSTIGSVLLCFAKQNGVSKVFMREDKWSEPTVLPFCLTENMSIVGLNGEIYFIGCQSNINGNSGNSDEVWKYNPETNALPTHILTLRIPVSAAVATDLLGYIYVIGGYDTQNSVPNPVKTVQRFNPVTKECREVASTYEAHWFPVVGQLQGFIYVAGNSGTVERYDPHANQWTWSSITPVPARPFGCCGAFGDGKFYMMPDKRHPNDLQVYDPSSNEWEKLVIHGTGPDHINGRWTIRTNEPNRSVMLVRDKSNALYCYNPGRNVWRFITPVSPEQLSYAEFCIILFCKTISEP